MVCAIGAGRSGFLSEVASMGQVSRYVDAMFRQIHSMEAIHWAGVAVVLVVVGIGCMRGMNTRM
jgi:hypothetical protein